MLQHLAKSYIPPGLNLGPPTTRHKILTTLLLAHVSILVCLRFGITSSGEDLSRLWNWLFCSRGLIPVWKAPGLMAVFSKFPSGIETTLQGDFQGALTRLSWRLPTLLPCGGLLIAFICGYLYSGTLRHSSQFTPYQFSVIIYSTSTHSKLVISLHKAFQPPCRIHSRLWVLSPEICAFLGLLSIELPCDSGLLLLICITIFIRVWHCSNVNNDLACISRVGLFYLFWYTYLILG